MPQKLTSSSNVNGASLGSVRTPQGRYDDDDHHLLCLARLCEMILFLLFVDLKRVDKTFFLFLFRGTLLNCRMIRERRGRFVANTVLPPPDAAMSMRPSAIVPSVRSAQSAALLCR